MFQEHPWIWSYQRLQKLLFWANIPRILLPSWLAIIIIINKASISRLKPLHFTAAKIAQPFPMHISLSSRWIPFKEKDPLV